MIASRMDQDCLGASSVYIQFEQESVWNRIIVKSMVQIF